MFHFVTIFGHFSAILVSTKEFLISLRFRILFLVFSFSCFYSIPPSSNISYKIFLETMYIL
jgi:hypothetical protein